MIESIQVPEPVPGFPSHGLLFNEVVVWGSHQTNPTAWKWSVLVRVYKASVHNVMIITDVGKGQSVTNGIEDILHCLPKGCPLDDQTIIVEHYAAGEIHWDDRYNFVTLTKDTHGRFKDPVWKDTTVQEIEQLVGGPISIDPPGGYFEVADFHKNRRWLMQTATAPELVEVVRSVQEHATRVMVMFISGESVTGYARLMKDHGAYGFAYITVAPSKTKNPKPIDWTKVDMVRAGQRVLYQRNYERSVPEP